MIEIEKFNSAIDGMDPAHARIKADVGRICNRELNTLPVELRDKVSGQLLAELQRRISGAYPYRLAQIPEAIADFARELRAAVINERATNPALRPWSAEDQIKQNINALNALHWNGNECYELRRMLKPGDVIARIGLRQIELASGVVLTRGDLRAHRLERRPRGVTPPDAEFLALEFTSDAALDDIEQSERIAKDKARRYQSGPPELIGHVIPGLEE